MSETAHIPVLMNEVLEALSDLGQISEPAFLDCTLGGGGHSEALLREHEGLFLVGADQDPKALERCQERLAPFSSRTQFVQSNFSELSNADLARQSFDGVLLDLGISSDQLNSPERGFAFSEDGPLDMRMDQTRGLTAAEILNSYSFPKLKQMFQRGGLGSLSARVADMAIKSRPINSTKEFASICREATPTQLALKKNPAMIPFQALRIEVNQEFASIEQFFSDVPKLLSPGGRLAAISFHSLEDKLVASALRKYGRKPSSLRKLPMASEEESFGKLLSKDAILPSKEEIAENSRAASARMRVFERRQGDNKKWGMRG